MPNDNFHIFLAWGGDEARQLAEWIRENIFEEIPGISTFISSKIPGGNAWVTDIFHNLDTAHAGVGIITEEAIERPWIIFELGGIRSRLGRPLLLSFCGDLPEKHPLAVLQLRDCRRVDTLVSALSDEIPYKDTRVATSIRKAFQIKGTEWTHFLDGVLHRPARRARLRLFRTVAGVQQSVFDLEHQTNILNNPCLAAVAKEAIEDVRHLFQAYPRCRYLSLHYLRYPEILIHLQESLEVLCLAAVALVDRIEDFWADTLGKRIRDTSHHDSCRIFVYDRREAFEAHYHHIVAHARKYDVLVMSLAQYEKVSANFRVTLDFSVLCDPKTKATILAYYDAPAPKAKIMFSGEEPEINRHLALFKRLRGAAIPLSPAHERSPLLRDGLPYYAECGKLADLLFPNRAPSSVSLKHSDLVDIRAYDNYEEDHPFYRRMHTTMLGELRERVTDKGRHLCILEVGSGTGLFTKRLIGLPNVDVVSVDPDPRGCAIQREKCEGVDNLTIVPADILSITRDDVFDVIMSSFSEHHIRPEQRKAYFDKLLSLLRRDGYIIIGDEFLREYEGDNIASYREAVQAYHQYIIDLAKKKGLHQFVPLEEAAMKSGLSNDDSRIDFKVSLKEYRQAAAEAGLCIVAEHCVSDVAMSSLVGGMYVVVMRRVDE
jgi:SAM-dependent methyltransferase